MKPATQDLLVKVGAGLLALYTVNKILEATGVTKTNEELAKEAAEKERLRKEAENALKWQGLTRPPSDYDSAANTIWNALKYSSIDDYPDVADNAFTTIINNNADLAYLKFVYGIRPLYNFGIKVGDFDLLSTLKREYADWRKERTVKILQQKGVNIQL